MKYLTFSFAFLLLLGCTKKTTDSSNNQQEEDPFKFEYTTVPSSEWTNLFYRKSGWFAADGIFSIPLSGYDQNGAGTDQKTLITFGDTYIGEVIENKPLPGNKMVNNTVAYFKGNNPDPANIKFHYKTGNDGSPISFFIPDNANSKPGQYYWGGDGFINKELNNQLYLFAYHVEMTGPDVFDFLVSNVSLLSIPDPGSPPFDNYRQLTTPFHFKNEQVGEGDLGAGILVNTEWAGAPNPDGYVYTYGCIGPNKSVVVARVKPADFEDFDQWRYWNGSSWAEKIEDLAAIADAASNELSVTPLNDGRFLLIFQVFGISDKVGMRVGLSPVGPFGPINEIWTTPEYNEPPGILPYNAKAHPNLSKEGELLISYNTITMDFWKDIQENAHIYRPRFIILKSKSLQ